MAPEAGTWHIRDTIHHSSGLECLMHKKFEPHMKFPSCKIGKSTLEDLPKLKDSATEPLYQVNMDSFLHQSLRLKGTIVQLFLLIGFPDTAGYME